MEIKEQKQGEIVILDLIGQIDVNSSQEFQEKFTEIVSRKEKFVILECSNLSYVSSSGLRVFLMFLKHMNQIGGKLVLSTMPEVMFEVFEISGFDSIFTITDTLDEGIAEFN